MTREEINALPESFRHVTPDGTRRAYVDGAWKRESDLLAELPKSKDALIGEALSRAPVDTSKGYVPESFTASDTDWMWNA